MKRIVKKFLYCLFLSSVLLNISGCSSSNNQQLNSAFQKISGLVNDEKSKSTENIRNMVLYDYKVGEYIENSMKDVTYNFHKSINDGSEYITIKGNITYMKKSVVLTLQYKKVDDIGYDLYTMTFDGVPANIVYFWDIYDTFNENAVAKGLKKVPNTLGGYDLYDLRDNKGVINNNKNIYTISKNDEYILPTSNSEYISVEYMKSMVTNGDTSLIRLAVNEMFARHGATFSKQKNIDYFSSKSWYNPIEGVSDEYIQENLFNDYEKANLKNLLYVESLYK